MESYSDIALAIEHFMVTNHLNKDDSIGYLIDALCAADMEEEDETA